MLTKKCQSTRTNGSQLSSKVRRRHRSVTNETLIEYLTALGHRVETVEAGGGRFIVIRSYIVPAGRLVGDTCDLGVQWSGQVPYVMPPAIHVRPAAVAMGTANSQASALGG